MPAKKDEAKKDKAAETKKVKAAEVKEEKAATAKKPKAAEATEEKAAKEEPAKAEKPAPAKKVEKPKAAGSPAIDEIIKAVETMTVLELSDLVKALEEKFGVSAAAPMALMPGMMAGAGPAEDAEEQTEFDVVLKEIGPQKIQVIKVVRAITGAGLIDAKKMVEDAPKAIKEAINKDEAEKYKAQIEEVGATVEIK